jgi:arylsulfatase A-like enzyme
MVHVTDLYPTLIKLAGASLDQPLPLDGMDVWPTIAEGKPSPRREVVYNVPGEFGREMGEPAIRVGDYKLVGEELYDISKDPHEKTDLAAKQPDVVKQLKARLEEVASQRRPPEKHDRIAGARPLVKGELENAQPHPDWLKEVAKQAADAADEEEPRPRRNRPKKQ